MASLTYKVSLFFFLVKLQIGANCMLDDWEENLAIITANRTKDDDLVIIHLGDCLWKERSEVLYYYFIIFEIVVCFI